MARNVKAVVILFVALTSVLVAFVGLLYVISWYLTTPGAAIVGFLLVLMLIRSA
jgi:hypothetical protein